MSIVLGARGSVAARDTSWLGRKIFQSTYSFQPHYGRESTSQTARENSNLAAIC
jgi:hypothetical protein